MTTTHQERPSRRSLRITRRVRIMGLALAVALVAGLAAVPEARADSHELCLGIPKNKKIGLLGGNNAFSKEPANTKEDLQRLMATHAGDITTIMESKGLGHVTPALMTAVNNDRGVTERDLQPGEILQWMVWRVPSGPRVSDGMCVATHKTYGAWEVNVPVQAADGSTTTYNFVIPKICLNLAYMGSKKTEMPPPTCALTVDRDCDAKTWSVDATGSSAGAKVTMTGPSGTKTVIDGSTTTWSSADSDPYNDYSFTVTAANAAGKTCTKTVAAAACEAPPPACSITVTPNELYKGQSAEVDITGHWAQGGLTVDVSNAKGEPTGMTVQPPFPAQVTFDKAGDYTLSATATNEVGKTADCSASVEVKSRWTFRPFAALVDPGSDSLTTDTERPTTGPVLVERSHFNLDSDNGLGASLEYRRSDRFGWEAALIFAGMDAPFMLDLNDAWGMTDGEVGFTSITVGPNFHLTPNSRADLYLGPFVGLVMLDGDTVTTLGESHTVDLDDEFTIGAQLGLDVPFSAASKWGLYAGARYMALSSTTKVGTLTTGDLDIDPLILGLGLSYDF